MALGLVFFSLLYVGGGVLMGALTSGLARLGRGHTLDERPLTRAQLHAEWRQSFHSILIFGTGMIVPWGFVQVGWAQFAEQAGALRMALEVAVLMIWNDVHFWINHRLLHTRALMRFHRDHHRSVRTTPWSTYSFHPVEALMLGNVILLPMVVHDFHFWSLAAVPVLSLLLNVVGHSNYEFFPSVSDTHPLAASRRHHLHHHRPQGNFGFALAFMDRLMHTSAASRSDTRHRVP
ncbi:sterol desaturase/sphingolipid hydroxylase (fatty acid hydroxylase superfamily) [Corticibacter populi]|nr:sterol desaturase/sphingolipid hydroxylase (fatty acid hydroxylase superfamily) [Corticibacter populi]